jgi:glycosyltransferase involved in cell wall biosynthesis
VRILVHAHRLELGGTQVNAVELAARVGAMGHEVALAAAPGPARALLEGTGVPYHPLPDADHHPSLAVGRALREVVRRHRPDLVHVWDWPQCLDAYFGIHLAQGLPLLHTDMSMDVTRFLPTTPLATFGTPALVERARARLGITAELLEPPVDTAANAPDAPDVDVDAFRARFALDPGPLELVVVSRLERWMKLDGIGRAIDATTELARTHDVRLTVVGEGSARDEVEDMARAAEDRVGRRMVRLTGGLVDPRPAYAMADVVLGMGGSALRAMAFARPLVVLGERGFARSLDEQTASHFVHHGWYGVGDGTPDPLVDLLGALIDDPDRRRRSGRLGYQLVRERYDLAGAATRLEDLYLRALAIEPTTLAEFVSASRTAGLLVADRTVPPGVRRRLRSVVGAR